MYWRIKALSREKPKPLFYNDGASQSIQHPYLNVHDWKSNIPIRLYHGKEDQTVPYSSSVSTLAAMQAQQASDIALIDCPGTPSDHKNCVIPYWLFMTTYFASMAEGL